MIKNKENVSSAVLEESKKGAKAKEASTGASLSINTLIKAAVSQANTLEKAGFTLSQGGSGGGNVLKQSTLSFGK